MDTRLKGKVAIVTGAGSGIGKALARRLAQDGAAVVISDIKGLIRRRRDRPRRPVRARSAWRSMFPGERVERMAAETMKALGRIDILVNNAALFSTLELRPFEQIPPEEWRKVMDVNTLGVFLCCRACVPHIAKAATAASSTSPQVRRLKGVPLFLHYIASKGAVIAMTRGPGTRAGRRRHQP